MFKLDAVSYRIPDKTLLHPINLSIDHGQVVGLIGHNGSGKSTLVKLLARQLTPSSGSITLEGKNLHKWGDRPLARQVAYLPQQLPPTEGLTARDLIRFGRYPWHGALGRFSREDEEQVRKAMALTDTERFADRSVDELSGGERQRVWLAMLLAQNARYMLLDEPTSALDLGHQIEVFELIRNLAAQGKTVVMVVHDLVSACRYADHLIAMADGTIQARGTPAEILDQSLIERLYGVHCDVIQDPASGTPVLVNLRKVRSSR